MKKVIIILSGFIFTLTLSLFGQNMELTFTGDNNGQIVLLDSVVVKNLNQGGEVTLYPPDLSLVLTLTGIKDESAETGIVLRLPKLSQSL